MESKQLHNELKTFRRRLKELRDQYSDVAERDVHAEVEDKARRAYIQLGKAQDSLETLSEELARAEKHMALLAKTERSVNTKRKSAEADALSASQAVHRDFVASELFKLK